VADRARYPLNLPGDLYRAVKAEAGRLDMSAARWMRLAIREKLERDTPEAGQ